MQLSLPLTREFVSLKLSSGQTKEMAAKRHHILARCYDKKGRLLSAAFNSYTKTHPIMQFFARKVGHPLERCYLHAEIHAILKCKAKRIYRITVERYDSFGFPANSKPCAICAAAIKAYGIQVVEHT